MSPSFLVLEAVPVPRPSAAEPLRQTSPLRKSALFGGGGALPVSRPRQSWGALSPRLCGLRQAGDGAWGRASLFLIQLNRLWRVAAQVGGEPAPFGTAICRELNPCLSALPKPGVEPEPEGLPSRLSSGIPDAAWQWAPRTVGMSRIGFKAPSAYQSYRRKSWKKSCELV